MAKLTELALEGRIEDLLRTGQALVNERQWKKISEAIDSFAFWVSRVWITRPNWHAYVRHPNYERYERFEKLPAERKKEVLEALFSIVSKVRYKPSRVKALIRLHIATVKLEVADVATKTVESVLRDADDKQLQQLVIATKFGFLTPDRKALALWWDVLERVAFYSARINKYGESTGRLFQSLFVRSLEHKVVEGLIRFLGNRTDSIEIAFFSRRLPNWSGVDKHISALPEGERKALLEALRGFFSRWKLSVPDIDLEKFLAFELINGNFQEVLALVEHVADDPVVRKRILSGAVGYVFTIYGSPTSHRRSDVVSLFPKLFSLAEETKDATSEALVGATAYAVATGRMEEMRKGFNLLTSIGAYRGVIEVAISVFEHPAFYGGKFLLFENLPIEMQREMWQLLMEHVIESRRLGVAEKEVKEAVASMLAYAIIRGWEDKIEVNEELTLTDWTSALEKYFPAEDDSSNHWQRSFKTLPLEVQGRTWWKLVLLFVPDTELWKRALSRLLRLYNPTERVHHWWYHLLSKKHEILSLVGDSVLKPEYLEMIADPKLEYLKEPDAFTLVEYAGILLSYIQERKEAFTKPLIQIVQNLPAEYGEALVELASTTFPELLPLAQAWGSGSGGEFTF